MRILLWNCNGGLNNQDKVAYFKAFKPDIAILPEIREKHIEVLAPSTSVWLTNNHKTKSPKGLGVLGFNGFQLELLKRDPDLEIYIPLKVKRKELSFNLLAFWNFYTACKQGRFKGVEGIEHAALEYFRHLLKDPVLVAGDLNYGPTFFQEDFLKLVRAFEDFGIKSLYHEHFELNSGSSKHATHRSSRKKYHHIDHIFGSKFFYENMSKFHVEKFENVVLSDHVPLVLDIELSAVLKK